jgi:hypothetical protein
MTQVSFTQTFNIDALISNESSTNDVRKFLEGTGWVYTEDATGNNFLRGIIHEEGKETGSASRKFFTQDSVVVKVNGSFDRVLTRMAFGKIYS